MARNPNKFIDALHYFPLRSNSTSGSYFFEYSKGLVQTPTDGGASDFSNVGDYYLNTPSYVHRMHSTSSYRYFRDSRLFPVGEKSIRFKIKSYNNSVYNYDTYVIWEADLLVAEGKFGLICYIEKTTMFVRFMLVKDGDILFNVSSNQKVNDNLWHDVLFTWNGGTQENGVKLYFDEKLVDTARAEDTESNTSTYVTSFGRNNALASSYAYPCYTTDLEIYDKVIVPRSDRVLVLDNGEYKYHDGTAWIAVAGQEEDFVKYGMTDLSKITQAQWGFLRDGAELHIWTDDVNRKNTYVVFDVEEKSIEEQLGESYTLKTLIQADIPNGVVLDETLPVFNLYDQLGSEIMLHIENESEKDVVVKTQIPTTDIYELYDEIEVLGMIAKESVDTLGLGDKIYTSVQGVYTPIDMFDEDVEIISIYEKDSKTKIEIEAIPAPQFTKLISPKKVYGYLNEVNPVDFSTGYREDLRFVLGNEKADKWYVWSTLHNKFIQVMIRNEEEILANGMKASQVQAITEEQWRTWSEEYVNIGIYLKNNPRGTIVSQVSEISYTDYLPRFTTTLTSADFNIINTTAHLTMGINGTTVKGYLGDTDGGKTQYRILVNNNIYFPEDGSFTDLEEGEQFINLTINSKVVTIGDWNNVKIEFKDSFGSIEYWSTNFIGTYTGIMFKDIYGSYFTSDVGELLQYLDFGVIVAGQTTLEHEIILKNQYGYDVQNLLLYAKYTELPSALEIQFSKRNAPFQPESELMYEGFILPNNEEMSFFVRLKTELGSTPNANGDFAIVVTADKVEEA